MKDHPASVRIREVGPRDGFQSEPETIATADKVRLIDMLSATGLTRMEITSFVRPDVIPQLSDAAEVLAAVQRREGVSFSVLIPNERGLERALEMRDRFDEISVFLSASESHNQRNVNRSIADLLAGLEATLARAGEAGLRRVGVISTSFGCPCEGEVATDRVFEIAERLAAAGCEEVGFGDTTGMANPRQVHEFFAAARERFAGAELTAHFHNTRGQGLANVVAAIERGAGDPGERRSAEWVAARLAAAAAAGLPAPTRARIGGWTDPALTLFAGLPTISLLSMRNGPFANYHLPTDTPDRVDWVSVGRCPEIGAATGAAWARSESPVPRRPARASSPSRRSSRARRGWRASRGSPPSPPGSPSGSASPAPRAPCR